MKKIERMNKLKNEIVDCLEARFIFELAAIQEINPKGIEFFKKLAKDEDKRYNKLVKLFNKVI